MNKAIKLVMTGLLVSANMLAQETDSIQQYGRGISVDWKESIYIRYGCGMPLPPL